VRAYTRSLRSVVGIGSWSARRPWRAIALWLAFVVAALALGVVIGTKSLENGAIGESARGYEIMDAHRAWPPAREYAYVHSATLTADDDAFQGAVLDAAAGMRAALGEQNVRLQRSADGHAVLVAGQITRFVDIDRMRVAVLAAGRSHPEVTVEETGDITASDARDNAVNGDLHRAELLSVPVTLFVLLFAFGAIVAALVPVLLALTAVAAAFGLLGPASQLFPLDDSVKIVVVLIGMAVGVDYALFYIIRSRAERKRGVPSHEALERTARTSGRTVVVSGTTVVIAMAGMFIIGAKVFNGIAAGTIIVVACAVAGSVTVLCAVLELLGPRIDRGRIPWLPHLRTDSSGSRFWPAVVDRVLRRPALSCALSAGFLIALAIPALWLHVGMPSDESLSTQDDPALAALPRLHADFPSTSSPALVTVTGPKEAAPAVQRELRHLQQLVQARGLAHPPFTVSGSFDDKAATLELPLNGAGDDAPSRDAVEKLRSDLVPATLGTIPAVETAVTGSTAENIDFTHDMKRGVPYVIAFVLTLAFVLLLVAF